MRITVASSLALALIAAAGAVHAVDIPVAAKKLSIIDLTGVSGRAKAVYLAKDAAITKGPGTDPALIGAQLDLSYDTSSGTFLAPQGTGWVLNKATVAKYLNRTAPTGGATKVSLIKPGKLIKLLGKSLGDTPIDISAPPTGSVLAVYTVTNDGVTNRQQQLLRVPAQGHRGRQRPQAQLQERRAGGVSAAADVDVDDHVE